MKLTASLIAVIVLVRGFTVLVLQRCVDVPDEWWQSTEVAYQHVFQRSHRSWEWESGLRSYFGYPMLFDVIFRLLKSVEMDTALLVWLVPRLVCAMVAAAMDVQTFRLGQQLDRLWP